MSAIRSQLLSMRQPPKPKDLFMLFLMCESPKFAAVWHLNISTLRVLPKHLFSRSMRYRSVQLVRQLLFAVSLGMQLWLHVAVDIGLPWKTTWFPWKEPILEIKVDVQYFHKFPIVYVAAGISPIYATTQSSGPRIQNYYTVMERPASAAFSFNPGRLGRGHEACLTSIWVRWGHTDPGRAVYPSLYRYPGPSGSHWKWPINVSMYFQRSEWFCSSELFNLVWL